MIDLNCSITTVPVEYLGEKIAFTYRNPTPEEIAAYQAALFVRTGGQVKSRVNETRLKFGERIVQGFEKGVLGADGKLIASDSNDPDHYPEWKKLISEKHPAIFIAIGQHAFESTRVGDDGVTIDNDFLGLFKPDSGTEEAADPQ